MSRSLINEGAVMENCALVRHTGEDTRSRAPITGQDRHSAATTVKVSVVLTSITGLIAHAQVVSSDVVQA